MRRALVSSLLLLLSGFAPAQKRPAITGIAFARVYASDPAASDRFYSGTLGYQRQEVAGVAHYPVNALQWIEVAPLPSPAPTARLAAVGFTTRDAAGLERYLKAHGVSIVSPLARGEFSVHDPEGNLIVFVQSGSDTMASGASTSPHATSRRIIHAGFVVKDADAENRFYRELLGFRPYWHGGRTDDRTDYVSQQVPDGTDWLEYMLNVPADANAHQLGGADHFSLGTAHMSDVVAGLAANHCEGPNCTKTQMGRDGKVQLNLFDPDLTRVEYMEFQPSGKTCCSEFTGRQPTEQEDR